MIDHVGFSLADGAELADVPLTDLWHRYLAIGGAGSVEELRRMIDGAATSDHEYNVIAEAINEVFVERGEDHPVRYRNIPPIARDADPGGV